MEGHIVSLNYQQGYGKIETFNKTFNKITFYLNTLSEKVNVNDTVSFEIRVSKSGIHYAHNVTPVYRNLSKYNTEDKQLWCKEGELSEQAFVKNIVPKIGLNIIINPDKITNPYAIDLWDIDNQKYADLKSQNTPFFYSGKYIYPKSGGYYNPTFTMSFNQKDYKRYAKLYPTCDIYVCINWTQLEYQTIHVQPLQGVWRARFPAMASAIQNGYVYLHKYIHRKDDHVNAKASYLFDLRDREIFEKIL